MEKKILILLLAITLTITGTACDRSDDTRSSGEPKTLNDIRSETEKLRELDSEFQNLNLSETKLYVPDVDEISDFSLPPVSLSAEEREALLLETAEKFDGSKADAENIVYLSFDFETIPYSEVENDPNRGENYFIKYLTDDLDLGINIDGNYIYARKKELRILPIGKMTIIGSILRIIPKKYIICAKEFPMLILSFETVNKVLRKLSNICLIGFRICLIIKMTS